MKRIFLLIIILSFTLCVFECLYSEEPVSKEPNDVSAQPTVDVVGPVSAAVTASTTAAAMPIAVVADVPVEKTLSGIDGAISLDLRNIEIVDALKFLAMKTGLNLTATKLVAGRVTIMVNNVSVKDVLDVMLRSNNLAYDKKGDIYNVMAQEEYRALYGKSFSDIREVKIFRLNYAIPEQAFSLFDVLKSDVGRILVEPESGHVLVMDSKEKIEIMERILKGFEEKNLIKVFKLNYAKAEDIETALKSHIDIKKLGLVKSDERSNQIVVQTLPDRMEQVEELIKQLDTQTLEVIIDSSIIKVKMSNDFKSGIEWEGLFNLGVKTGLTYLGSTPFSAVGAAADAWRSRRKVLQDVGYTGSYPFSGTTSSFASGTKKIGTEEMHLGVINDKYDYDTVINYLETLGDTKIISNPKLAVVNNKEAKIHVGEKDAYVTTTTTTGQTTSTISEQVTFVDVGVMLSVVPTIGYDGFVTLKVKAEISSVIDTLITPTKNQIPIIDTSLAETTVMVKEGSTIIIGGLRKEQVTENTTQTPYLGKIPLLGKLFSAKTKRTERTELLIMITPKLITGRTLVLNALSTEEIGKNGPKLIKEYEDLKKKNVESSSSVSPEAITSVDKKELTPKGMKLLSH